MEKIFYVANADLDEVNEALAMGGKVKMIHTVAESVAGTDDFFSGNVFLYVVVEMPTN